MVKRSSHRWGALFYAAAALLVVGVYAVMVRSPHLLSTGWFGEMLPWFGLAASALALCSGHFSYPRIQNLKVYLAGYLVGVCGICYFLLHIIPFNYADVRAVSAIIHTAAGLNAAALPLAPSYVKYRVTRRVTWGIAGSELALFAAAALSTTVAALFGALDPLLQGKLITLSGPASAAVSLGLSLWLVRREFHLGGILAATGLLYGAGWGAWLFFDHADTAEMLLTASASLFFVMASIVHWFVRMEHRIAYDPLLHIYNREYCTRVLNEQSRVDTRPPFVIAMIDIDHFKKFNDTHGHQAGDLVLTGVAQLISRCVVPDGTVCRYGGEEMTVFFPHTTARDAQAVMNEVRETIEKTRIPAGKKRLSVTVSIGLSQRESLSQTLHAVLESADKALYRAKKGGRNQVKSGKVPTPGGKRK